MQNGDQKAEKKFLDDVTIGARFEWTGKSNPLEDDAEDIEEIDEDEEVKINALTKKAFHDLVLWNVLGCAYFDDSLGLPAVCKAWRDMCKEISPPIILKISRHLQMKAANLKYAIQEGEATLLWGEILRHLTDHGGPLYRKDKKEQAAEVWPDLKPHFNVLLVRFVYAAATQRSPNNHAKALYDSTVQFLKDFAADIVAELWALVDAFTEGNTTSVNAVDHLIIIWQKWSAVSLQIGDLTNYLERYYCKHHTLPTIMPVSERALVSAISNSLLNHESGRVLRLLDDIKSLLSPSPALGSSPYIDRLLIFWDIYEKANVAFADVDTTGLDVPESWGSVQAALSNLNGLFTESLLTAREEASRANISTSIAATLDTTASPSILLISQDKTKFPVNPGFLELSGFLRRLRLRSGDVVQLGESSDTIELVFKFYDMESECPMSPIESGTIAVDQPYQEFVDGLSQKHLFGLVELSNFLDVKKLMDLCCWKVYMLIKDMSGEEIQQMFQIED